MNTLTNSFTSLDYSKYEILLGPPKFLNSAIGTVPGGTCIHILTTYIQYVCKFFSAGVGSSSQRIEFISQENSTSDSIACMQSFVT